MVATLGWTWLLLGVAALLGRPWESTPTLALFAVAAMGPALIASVMIASETGWVGLGRFWADAVAFHRVTPGWWAIIVVLAVLPPLVARGLTPGVAAGPTAGEFVVGFVVVGVLAGLAEEPGWRGYGVDGLLTRRPPAASGVLVGLVWALWHLPLFLIEGTYQHGLGVGTSAFWSFVLVLQVQGVVYAWIYVGTGRRVAAVVGFHALFNLAAETLSVDEADVIEAGLWVLVAALAAAPRWMRISPKDVHAGPTVGCGPPIL